MTLRDFGRLLKQTAIGWDSDNIARHGAALSFYALFSMAPLLLVVIAISGMLFPPSTVETQLLAEIRAMIGSEGANTVQTVIRNASLPGRSIPAIIVGGLTFFLGATAAFAALQGALNAVWNVEPRAGSAIWSFVRTRILSFAMVVGAGFLLLVSLVLSAGLSALSDAVGRLIPGPVAVWQAADTLLTFGVVTLLFAGIYKVLPDVELTWADVWRGAAITAAFFTGGKFLIGLYLGQSAIASSYGAAGSLVVLLFWIYYNSQIVLLGAEFTQKYVLEYRHQKVRPSEHAEETVTSGSD